MGKYATYLDLRVSGVEEYKLDLFPLLDPTLLIYTPPPWNEKTFLCRGGLA